MENEAQNEQPTPETLPEMVAPIIIELSEEQEEFISLVLDKRQNVLLLGKAGVGKSTAVRSLCDAADDRGMSYVRCAPTGKAAINISGETVHRFIATLSSQWRSQQVINLNFILIDEVSMVRADLLDQLSSALKSRFMSDQPFGGVQIVLVGDPGQLPPVVDAKDDEYKYLRAHYLTHHFFGANSFHQTKWHILELSKIFRQKDERFPKLLNLIRSGDKGKPVAFLNKFRTTETPKGVILTARNADADEINLRELKKLAGESETYRADIVGEIQPRDYPADNYLQLKIGARVMVIKNIYGTSDDERVELELINGDVGTVTELEPDCVSITCDRTGREHQIYRAEWTKKESVFDEETKRVQYKAKGSFIQVPLRLAWAVTIHKAQGATIEEVTIDLRKPFFCAGQLYVALSRGVSLERLWIMGKVRPKDVMTDDEVTDFLDKRILSKFVGIKDGSQFDMKELGDEKEAFKEMFGE